VRPSTLTIRLERRTDGAVIFELRRADGTSTWQTRTGPTAEFFAVHDLTHYAVETTLRLEAAFYGLVAAGWGLDDFGNGWPRGPLPAEALAAEVIVGQLDAHRAGQPLTAASCNDAARDYFGARGITAPLRITDSQLDTIRARLSDLVWRWYAAAPGERIELSFPPDAA
jgi:hypothetical protein